MKTGKLKTVLAILLIALILLAIPHNVKAAEEGTMIQNAINITFNKQYTKGWTKSSDHLFCYNKITVNNRGILKMNFTKPTDYEGEYGTLLVDVYDSAGKKIWDTHSHDARESATPYYTYYIGLDKGTYYVAITPGFRVTSGLITVDYSFSFIRNDYCEIEPNENRSNATNINFGKIYQGYFGNDYGDIGEHDFYKMSLVAGRTYRIKYEDEQSLFEGTTAITRLHMPNGGQKSLDAQGADDDGYQYIEFIAPVTGDYYIEIYNYNRRQLPYKLGIFDVSVSNNLDSGTSIEDAKNITIGKTYSKSWSDDNKEITSYNKIHLDSKGILTIEIQKPLKSNNKYMRVITSVLDANGNVIFSGNEKAEVNSKNYVYNIGLDKGNYYISMLPDDTYKLDKLVKSNVKVSFTKNEYCEVESNDEAVKATTLTLNRMYQAYYESSEDDVSDYYKATLLKGKKYKISIENFEKMQKEYGRIYLYSPNGKKETISYDFEMLDSNFNNCYEFTAEAGGTYYIQISGYINVSYPYKIGVYGEAPVTTKPTSVKLGDVNKDGKINTKDAREVLLAYIGKKTLTKEQKQAADVNKDGKINTKDARQILLYYIGKIKKF